METNDKYIMTVTGPVKNTELGFCHGHEHLFLSKGQSYELNHDLLLDDFDKTAAELTLFKEAGGRGIIDAQPVGCGRMAENLAAASRQTGVHIVASTGFHKMIFYPAGHWIHTIGAEAFEELLISEITQGMFRGDSDGLPTERTDILPGVIKIAADVKGVAGGYRRLFEAASAAGVKTGLPVMCHTEMGKKARETAEFLLNKGLTPEQVIICHIDRVLTEPDALLEVAKTGVFMELDTIGRFKYHSDEDEATFIKRLVEQGYEDKILLGLDTTRARMKSYGGSLGLDYISRTFLPHLRRERLADTVLHKFMVTNPANAYSIRAKAL